MISSATLQARLNCIHPTVFPLHRCCEPEESGMANKSKNGKSVNLADQPQPSGDPESGLPSDRDLHSIGLLGGGKYAAKMS